MGTAVTLAAFPLLHPPPEAFWFLAAEQALVFAGRTPLASPPPASPSMAGASPVGTGCSLPPASSLCPAGDILLPPHPAHSFPSSPHGQNQSLSVNTLPFPCSGPAWRPLAPMQGAPSSSGSAPSSSKKPLHGDGDDRSSMPLPSDWGVLHPLQLLLTGQDKVLHLREVLSHGLGALSAHCQGPLRVDHHKRARQGSGWLPCLVRAQACNSRPQAEEEHPGRGHSGCPWPPPPTPSLPLSHTSLLSHSAPTIIPLPESRRKNSFSSSNQAAVKYDF